MSFIGGYEIERSLDGRTFARLGQVAARGGPISTRYACTDAAAMQVVGGQPVYYCLRVLELVGNATYSPMASVVFLGATLVAWPSPFSTRFSLNLASLLETAQ